MRRKLKAAIVGLGQIGSRYQEKRSGIVTHAQMYQSDTSFDLVAGYDPNPTQRQHFKKRYPKALVYSDLKKMMTEVKPHVVSVASPPQFHLENIANVLPHKPKAIFCEKPLAHNLNDANKIKSLIDKSQTHFLVNFSRRFDKTHQQVKKDIQNKRWGSPRLIEGYVSGSFTSMASHLIDSISWFFGPIKAVQCLGPFKSIEHPGSVRLVLKDGICAWIHTLPDYLIYELDMYFSGGRVRLTENGFSSQVWKKSSSSLFAGFNALKSSKSVYPKGYQNVFKNAGMAIKIRKQPSCTVRDGLKCLEVMNAIEQSGKQKNKIIRLNSRGSSK